MQAPVAPCSPSSQAPAPTFTSRSATQSAPRSLTPLQRNGQLSSVTAATVMANTGIAIVRSATRKKPPPTVRLPPRPKLSRPFTKEGGASVAFTASGVESRALCAHDMTNDVTFGHPPAPCSRSPSQEGLAAQDELSFRLTKSNRKYETSDSE
eukprot:4081548-Pleurochrysis_carterae.AAC.2